MYTDGILVRCDADPTTNVGSIFPFLQCGYHLCYLAKRSVLNIFTCESMASIHRVMKQAVTSEVNVLGGVCLKPALPSVIQALTEFLQENGLEMPPGPLTTVYKVELRGNVYHRVR